MIASAPGYPEDALSSSFREHPRLETLLNETLKPLTASARYVLAVLL